LPVDIYIRGIQLLLTVVVPVAVIMTFPAKALLGLLHWPYVVFGLVISVFFMVITLKFWHYALSRYSSASS